MHGGVGGAIALIGSSCHGADELQAVDVRPCAQHSAQRHADEIPSADVLHDGVHEVEEWKLHLWGGAENALLDDVTDGIGSWDVFGGDGGELVDDDLGVPCEVVEEGVVLEGGGLEGRGDGGEIERGTWGSRAGGRRLRRGVADVIGLVEHVGAGGGRCGGRREGDMGGVVGGGWGSGGGRAPRRERGEQLRGGARALFEGH
ncbi:hypothetical protein FGB62_98g052 [Gracilaria domingensis]|nr:hypothetical protein FGB62_98g052 [Gracilaria domingensis]